MSLTLHSKFNYTDHYRDRLMQATSMWIDNSGHIPHSAIADAACVSVHDLIENILSAYEIPKQQMRERIEPSYTREQIDKMHPQVKFYHNENQLSENTKLTAVFEELRQKHPNLFCPIPFNMVGAELDRSELIVEVGDSLALLDFNKPKRFTTLFFRPSHWINKPLF